MQLTSLIAHDHILAMQGLEDSLGGEQSLRTDQRLRSQATLSLNVRLTFEFCLSSCVYLCGTCDNRQVYVAVIMTSHLLYSHRYATLREWPL